MGFQPVMPRTDGSPQTAENRTLCRARALSKREAFVARGRGRRQPAEAGAYLRSKYADSPRKASTLYRCDVIESQPAMRRINVAPGGKSIPEFRLRLGCGFRMTFQAETASQNRRSEWDSFSGRRLKRKVHPGIPPQTGTHFPLHLPPRKTCAPSIPKLGRRKPKRNRRRST